MRASILFSAPLFAAAALAQSTSVDEHPQTTYLTQTNSLGVVTGQPAVATSQPPQPPAATSQPAVVTTQPDAASIPALGSGVHTVPQVSGNSTSFLTVSISNTTTSFFSPTIKPSGSTTGSVTRSPSGTDASGSPTGTATTSSSTGAAATMRAMAGGVVGVGAFVAAFL
ncbi:hypothetical protein GQ43DRAFT_482827 [Delitschia confertaspora ATCC 74209]|uniref:Uncharacterized protein n=1 Tax=Delitschia confertaspora ATCC 74209 TaxID=1513339 RepID=A0A9P4JGK9_9PLEO|nr:hypothetical protein GQ43DRAFT_482827 [Delitschia confertaspora ATCC 74209]